MALYLGLSGWYDRGHDAAAALIREERGTVDIIGAVEEERFTGNRYSLNELPVNSIRWCLEQISSDFDIRQLDGIAFGWDWPRVYDMKNLVFDASSKLKNLWPVAINDDVTYLRHHKCHAASAYHASGFEEAAIVVLDGQGEDESGTVWKYADNRYQLLSQIDIPSSLGYLYQATSNYIGFGSECAGKTMGLSSFGKPTYYHALRDLFQVNGMWFYNKELVGRKLASDKLDDQETIEFYWIKKFSQICKLPPNKKKYYDFEQFPQPYLDLAASVQKLVIELMLMLLKAVQRHTQCKNVCLAGGSFLNCIANGELVNLHLYDNIFIQPAANDAGVALGAAFLQLEGKKLRLNHDFSPFMGPSVADGEIIHCLKDLHIEYSVVSDAADTIAQWISEEKTVGLFQGRMEYGPRALGNRSIIASPVAKGMRDRINAKIKRREHGRPFGPSVLDVDVADLFGDRMVNQYMTISQELRNPTMCEIRHVDGTTRPNVVTSSVNSLYYSQLRSIKNLTGYGVVINTSLNCAGPIINTPGQAVELFKKTDIDHIVFNNQIII